ncbi:MAG: aminopeptidase [Armatimonadota bacterium]|nr:aminopeptidase [Armatimonadota bacterium]MDR7444347.1 aminopeptidase [Armatimonadota bacterium]MDR7569662.1 aminopeptidase [Armatimonadota bacterium]MDR7614834.1 aminopeptidase [Armatimonadota bacterium]
MDPRVTKLAQVLVQYSLEVRPGQLVRIAGPAIAEPLLVEGYRQVLRAGAHPLLRVTLDGIDEVFYKEATEAQLRYVPELQKLEVEHIDASLGVWANYNTRALTNTPPERQRIRREALREVSQRFLERAATGELRWVGTQYPTQADAQEAEMSLREYEDFVYGAGHLDAQDPVAVWREIRARQQRIADFLGTKRTLRILAEGTDLTVGVAGRTWVNAAGEHNFPDGEVFTGPEEDRTEGHVQFSFPAIYGGREVSGVRLVFERGRVVHAEATKGQDFLQEMLGVDEGARVLGEFAFGLNENIQRFTRNILFDEKIGGTIHMALGSSYPETGGRNQSGLHWDMICDLRRGGEVYADGELVYRDGKFLLP